MRLNTAGGGELLIVESGNMFNAPLTNEHHALSMRTDADAAVFDASKAYRGAAFGKKSIILFPM